jgi:transcriptional regulator GlxA family with amidase domain
MNLGLKPQSYEGKWCVRIAILLFEQVTALDIAGPYKVLSYLPDAEVICVGERVGPVRNEKGTLGLMVDAALPDVPDPDIILIPGGPGQLRCMSTQAILNWLRTTDRHTKWTTSVCTESPLLAAAGIIKGRKATTHWLAFDQLSNFGVTPVSERVVFDGKYATAAGVSAGIDMALSLCAKINGEYAAQAIQLGLEYDPQPPFNAGSVKKAPSEIVQLLRSRSEKILKVAS